MSEQVIQPGVTVDGFQLVRVLGEGPIGIVWLGKDVRKSQTVAIKLLKPHVVSQSVGRATFSRLLAAIKTQGALSHPRLASVLRTVQEPQAGAFGLAMEHIEGQSLDRLKVQLLDGADGKVIDPRRLSRLFVVFEQLGEVLAWLHARDVVHGNLKPSNVMLLSAPTSTEIKVLDLAWSAIGVSPPQPGVESFLAPEQLGGSAATAFSDQWAIAQMLRRSLDSGTQPIGWSSSGAPPGMGPLLERALKPAQRDRFASMRDFIDALRHLRQSLHEEPPTDRQISTSLPPGSPWGLGIASPQGFQEEPATVKVPISSKVPKVDDRERTIDDGEEMVAALEAKAARSSSEISIVEAESFVTGDFNAAVTSEPVLVIDSLAIPAGDAPEVSTAREEPVPRASPLALWGLGLLLAALVIVFGAVQWSKRGAPSPKFVPRSAIAERTVAPRAAAHEPQPSPDPAETPRGLISRAASHPPGAHRGAPEPTGAAAGASSGRPLPEEEGGRATSPRSGGGVPGVKGARGDDGPRSRVLDAKADAAMARLAALRAPEPAIGDGGPEPRLTPATRALEEGLEPEVNGETRKSLEVGCDEGDGAACIRLGESWRAVPNVGADKARSAFERACAFSRATGCILAADLWARAQAPNSGGRVRSFLERACALRNAESCHRAAEMWRVGKGGATDGARARELEQAACKNGRKGSCVKEATTSTAADSP